jgi:hypothetical protein
MTMKRNDKLELVVVFKKMIEPDAAKAMLDSSGVNYRKGMDSSRGKIYFYSTGPKFILTFETQQDLEQFQARYDNKEGIHEIYVADWTKCKD